MQFSPSVGTDWYTVQWCAKTPISARNLTEFYKCFWVDEHDQLKSYIYWMILVFGSKYLHEKTFLKIKYIKSHYPSAIRDQHFQPLP